MRHAERHFPCRRVEQPAPAISVCSGTLPVSCCRLISTAILVAGDVTGDVTGDDPRAFLHSSAQKSLTSVWPNAPVERLVAPGEATAMICAGYRGSGRLTVLCGRQLDHAGRRTRNAFPATLHPASAGPCHPDQELARTAAQAALPSVQLPGSAGLRRRPHAFHTDARRWNRGHDSRAKSPDPRTRDFIQKNCRYDRRLVSN